MAEYGIYRRQCFIPVRNVWRTQFSHCTGRWTSETVSHVRCDVTRAVHAGTSILMTMHWLRIFWTPSYVWRFGLQVAIVTDQLHDTYDKCLETTSKVDRLIDLTCLLVAEFPCWLSQCVDWNGLTRTPVRLRRNLAVVHGDTKSNVLNQCRELMR